MVKVLSLRHGILISLLTVLPICALFAAQAFAGGAGPGGGDAILCRDGHVYALDYELTNGSSIPVAASLQDRSLYPTGKDILNEIAAELEDKIPALGASLNNFLTFNEVPSANQTRLWINTGNPLVYLNDQDIDVIPKNCLSQDGEPNVRQAVIRTPIKNGYIIYKRDQRVISALAQNSPLQVSYMYIHEWLRDYTGDADIIRNVNLYLHSLQWQKLSDEDFRAVLTDFGLNSVASMVTLEQMRRYDNEYKSMERHLTYGNPSDDATLIYLISDLKKCDSIHGNDAESLNDSKRCLENVYLTDIARYAPIGPKVYRDVIKPFNEAILHEIVVINNQPSMLNADKN